jgi:hypothetical protein
MAAARYCGFFRHGPLKSLTMKNPVVTAEKRIPDIVPLVQRWTIPICSNEV